MSAIDNPSTPTDAGAGARVDAQGCVSRWVLVYWGATRTAAHLRTYQATGMVTTRMLQRWVLDRTRMQARYVAAILRVAPFMERRRKKEEAPPHG